MSDLRKRCVYIFGAGSIGLAHFEAFSGCGFHVIVVSKSGGERQFRDGRKISTVRFNKTLFKDLDGCGVVVALPISQQVILVQDLLRSGSKPTFLLVEKPFSLFTEDFIVTSDLNVNAVPIYVAFNRRFMPSVSFLRELINREGCTSMQVDLSENITRLKTLVSSQENLANWPAANSVHMIDLASYLLNDDLTGGVTFSSSTPSKIFDGPGVGTKIWEARNGCLLTFTYDFSADGAWTLIACIAGERYKLSPIEVLLKFDSSCFEWIEVPLPANFKSVSTKLGFLEQAEALRDDGKANLVSLGQAQSVIAIARSMIDWAI